MASKFDQFLKDNQIDPRRLLATSCRLERLRREDRVVKLQKRQGKTEEAGKDEEKKAPPKPRSGRPASRRLLHDVSAGKSVSGPAKTRLLRAVNHVLEQKKKDPVDLRALF